MSVTSWFLVSSSGTRHRLPPEMIFVGREECELMLQSRSVDKQHAVVNYDPATDEHMVKDLGSLNGTFVNDLRIPDQTYITLKLSDVILASETPVSKPTPLYGQPSWWGEDDAEHGEGQRPDEDPAENTKESYRQVNGSLSDSQARSIYSHHREPSYFEIPTKEFQQRELLEVPTKDTDPPAVPVLPPAPTSTPPVVQSHASFTIEFDECMPGKIKIKDHVTKFSFHQQRKLLSKEAVTAPTEVMSAESKVADWLDQSDVRMMQRWSRTEDILSTNSDLPVYNKASTGHHHEDGNRGNSEDSVVNGKQVIQSNQGKADPQQAFVIEFFDGNPRKKRSQTFTNNTVQPDSPALRNKLEKKLGPSTPTQQYTIPLKGPGSGGPQKAGSLRREKTEDRINTSFSSQSSSIQPRPFRSVGRRSKLAQDFTAEFLRESRQETRPSMNTTWERKTSPVSPTISPPPTEMAAVPRSLGNEEDDALSEAGTYTIETEVQDEEVVEARSKIDQAIIVLIINFIKNASFCFHSVGGRTGYQAMLSRNVKSVESEGQSSRTRRILPQAPLAEKETPTPSILVHQDTYSTYDVSEKSSRALCPQEGLHNLSVQDDLDPDSLSDASKSDDGSIVDQRTTPTPDMTDKSSSQSREEERPRLPPKSTSFYIDSEERGSRPNTPRTERKLPPPPNTPQFSTGRVSPQPKDISVSLVRQESFTKDQPSDATQVTRLPHISSQPALNDPDPAEVFQGICSQDTHSYLKETEDALAALEAKLQAQNDVVPCPVDDALSGESDIDSASTASQRSNQTAPKTRSKKPSITCGLQRERSSASSFTQEPSRLPSAHDRLSEKQRSKGEDSSNKPEPGRRLGMRRSVGKHGSMDLSDDSQSSSLPYWPDTISSDQEGYRPSARKKYAAPLQKESSKSSKVSQALSRSNSMNAPRPTRASMLRRARLGEASDNEGTETDRISQEVSGTTKASQDSKKQLSRLDMLALPRKRTSSFTTPSDTESSAPRTGFSNRSTESNSGSGRKASVSGPSSKPVLGRASGAPCKPITRGRSSSAKYTSSTASSRRRQKGSDYTSTSEEEYDSGNQVTPKHKRSQTPSASCSQPLIPPRPKPRSRDSDQESHEGDAYQNWSSHSAEIAKLSQDLAKDLAILAREIHDVAGDTDPQSSSGVEANTPASTMSTQDELVHPIPEAGVNYQRAPPGSPAAGDPDQTMVNEQEHNSKHRQWNQEEVVVDDLMLNPVSQISLAIRENTEQLAEKIKVLFHNKQDVWEEIEAKINAENDIPVQKGSNKEITSILKELRRVQRQLEVINTIIEPSGNLEPAKTSTPISPSSASVRPSRAPSRDWRSLGSQRGEGGVSSSSSRSSESVRRSAMASEAESYVV
uniref:Centrosomal protein 170B n=1 Tax=Salmo trutta TaxID=8032 RepID=A0A674EHY6_SALTR